MSISHKIHIVNKKFKNPLDKLHIVYYYIHIENKKEVNTTNKDKLELRHELATERSQKMQTRTVVSFKMSDLNERMQDVLRLQDELARAVSDLRAAAADVVGVEIAVG